MDKATRERFFRACPHPGCHVELIARGLNPDLLDCPRGHPVRIRRIATLWHVWLVWDRKTNQKAGLVESDLGEYSRNQGSKVQWEPWFEAECGGSPQFVVAA